MCGNVWISARSRFRGCATKNVAQYPRRPRFCQWKTSRSSRKYWLNDVIAKSNFTGTNQGCFYKVEEDLIPATLSVRNGQSMSNRIEHFRIAANGIHFHVAVAGPREALPILFLHGFPEGWMSWQAVMEALSEYRVYATDLRDYPETESPRLGYDVFTLTDDIRSLIEALGLVQPALVSHDWGGALGWI